MKTWDQKHPPATTLNLLAAMQGLVYIRWMFSMIKKLFKRPALLLLLAIILGLATAGLGWGLGGLPQAQARFLIAFDAILAIPLVIFPLRAQLQNRRTQYLLLLAFLLLGVMLILVGILGSFQDSLMPSLAFIFCLFLPGGALLNMGIRFISKSVEVQDTDEN